jgi:hypothetical protein
MDGIGLLNWLGLVVGALWSANEPIKRISASVRRSGQIPALVRASVLMCVCMGLVQTVNGCAEAAGIRDRLKADRAVESMRGMSMILQPGGKPTDRELRRSAITQQLHDLGAPAILALTRALRDSDVQMRQNAALVLIYLGGGHGPEAQPALDTRAALPSLINATRDPDGDVRGWAARAIAEMGPAAEPAIPALVTLLRDPQEGPRNTSCIALRRIGPAASPALPALREALKDPSVVVRGFARRAIERIEKN